MNQVGIQEKENMTKFLINLKNLNEAKLLFQITNPKHQISNKYQILNVWNFLAISPS
jgi:hypothetical protein